jgi:hypothetical protein
MSNQGGFFNLTSINATETHGNTAAFGILYLWSDLVSFLIMVRDK